MEKIKWSEKIMNENVLECMVEKRMLLNNIFDQKANWFSHILRRNHLLHDTIEGKMTRERSRKKKNIAP